MGVCQFDQGARREAYDPTKPAYAAWQHYDSPVAWADASLGRLKSWGFTTIGGWSDLAALAKSDEHTLWITPVLHLGSTAGLPWLDMWDDHNLRRAEEVAIKEIVPLRDDSRVMGYYSDNELGWWNAELWKFALEQPATSRQRQRLILLLREVYHDDWAAVVKDFIPQDAASWEELERGGSLRYRPGSRGIVTMRRFLGLMADRYYQLMRDMIQKYDPDALYLGDRYQSFYYPEVARAAAGYVDIVSTNLNASWNDGTFLRSYLDSLHVLTGKPILVTEFYMAAAENRSGNKNSSSGFPVVRTQRERADSVLNTLNQLTQLPYVVGADWFQYYDEPPHGRYDGEDYNFGLVDIHDVPYEEVTNTFARFELPKRLSRSSAPSPEDGRAESGSRLDATSGVPPAPADPFADFTFMQALKHWDRQQGFVPPASVAPPGDLYACWSPEALYLGLYAIDIVETAFYDGSDIPVVDRAVWSVRLSEKESIRAKIGGGAAPIVSEPKIRVECLSGLRHNVRLIAIMELPAIRLGRERFTAGDNIDLDVSLTTHGRAYQADWNGRFTLSD
jgi:hypothetical protein